MNFTQKFKSCVSKVIHKNGREMTDYVFSGFFSMYGTLEMLCDFKSVLNFCIKGQKRGRKG